MPTQSIILHARSRYHEWQGVGPLSLKTFYGGAAHYTVAGGRYRVDDHCYLLLNAGQEYAITVDAPTAVESFCLFFAPGLAEDIFYSLTTATANLLDEPIPPKRAPLCFYERTYAHDAVVSPALLQLRTASTANQVDDHRLDEQFHQIMQQLLVRHQQVQNEVLALPYLRVATREELYRRLYRARDYLLATLDQSVTLDEMAAQASLSPNHFLRTFKALFQQTPHQYLLHQRLQRAAQLVTTTHLSITEIALAVGFASLGSFSWRFRRAFGQSPEQYRRAKR